MLWKGRSGSSNVSDRRFSGTGIAVGGGVIGIIVYLINMFMGGGGDMSQITQPGSNREMTQQEQVVDDERAEFVKVVLKDTEDVWNKLFTESGSDYKEPHLVLFRDGVESACGSANSAVGPFYCPGDEMIYIDLSFYDDLQQQFNASGDFAMAYVIAHEVGHHIQKQMGISDKMQRLREKLSEEEYNRYSVKQELQADFLAGVWAHHAQAMKGILEPGDIEEALNAANAIGDDKMQKRAQGYVVPDAFTHGTSAQRMYWFKKGFESGDPKQGDTFNAEELN
ncbi:MAG: neutral zinc metallopeptidase [Bacteroidota bacterium]|nr:neutral zinc metallopeptidase [Bacteroidota bacterium]